MDIAKEKKRILDYITGLQDSAAIHDLKNFIDLIKEKQESKVYPADAEATPMAEEPLTEYKTEVDEDAEYELTEEGLKILEERQAEYDRGEYLTAEEADKEAQKWL